MKIEELWESKMVLFCGMCKHEFQDKRYGKNKRVFNKQRDANPQTWKCTICGNVKNFR